MDKNTPYEEAQAALTQTDCRLVLEKAPGDTNIKIHIRYDRGMLEQAQALRMILGLAYNQGGAFTDCLEDMFTGINRSNLTEIVKNFSYEQKDEFHQKVGEYLAGVVPMLVDFNGVLGGTVLLDLTHLDAELNQRGVIVVASSDTEDPYGNVMRLIEQSPALQERIMDYFHETYGKDNETDYGTTGSL